MATQPELEAYARQQAIAGGVDPDLIVNQIWVESGFNPNAVSPAGAVGISQFMPATADAYGIDPANPYQSIQAQVKYMSQLLHMFGGDTAKALAGYNWGQGNVQRKGMENLPRETKAYIAQVMGTQAPRALMGKIKTLPGTTQPAALVASSASGGTTLLPGESMTFQL